MIGSSVAYDVTPRMLFTATFSPSVGSGSERSFALAQRHDVDVHLPFVATTVTRNRVVWDETRYDFTEPLALILERDEDGWSYYCPTLDLVGGGGTLDEALAAFDSEFAFVWEEIACEVDKELLPSARELKERLLQLVSGVGKAT